MHEENEAFLFNSIPPTLFKEFYAVSPPHPRQLINYPHPTPQPALHHHMQMHSCWISNCAVILPVVISSYFFLFEKKKKFMFNPLWLYLNGEVISKYKNDNLEKISQKKYQSPAPLPPFKATHLYVSRFMLIATLNYSFGKYAETGKSKIR